MNLVYQWCMSSSRISSRLEQWVPIIPAVVLCPEILQGDCGEAEQREESVHAEHRQQCDLTETSCHDYLNLPEKAKSRDNPLMG